MIESLGSRDTDSFEINSKEQKIKESKTNQAPFELKINDDDSINNQKRIKFNSYQV